MNNEKKFLDLAMHHIQRREYGKAKEIFFKLIEDGSKNYLIFGDLAIIYGIEGNLERMYKFLLEAIKIEPNYPDAHNNLGFYYTKKGDYESAIKSYKNALKLNPYLSDSYYNLGVIFADIGNFKESIKFYKKVIEINPKYFYAYYNLALVYKELDEVNNSLNSFYLALQINPKSSETYNNLGIIFLNQNNVQKAIKYFQKSIINKFDNYESLNNLGIAYERTGNYDKSIFHLKQALKYNNNYPEAFFNLANAQKASGQIRESILSYSSALRIKPNYQEALFNYSLALFLTNRYQEAWDAFESRFDNGFVIPHVTTTNLIRWRGEKLDNDEKLLIVSEQGLGDTIQFMRYIPHLTDIGYGVDFVVEKKLHSLIKNSEIINNPLLKTQVNKFCKYKWIPLMSLGKVLDINPLNKLCNKPYIKTKYEFDKKWNNILAKENKPIIGINWQGNEDIEKGAFKGRSLLLETFLHIVKKNNINFVSLQKGYGSEQLEKCSFIEKFVDSQPQIDKVWDFLELASIMKNCSLIITSDTCVAHLSGGLGLKTWLLLKKVPDWRWGINNENTFWYSSVRIFRQKNEGNWDEVLLKVSEELESFLKQ